MFSRTFFVIEHLIRFGIKDRAQVRFKIDARGFAIPRGTSRKGMDVDNENGTCRDNWLFEGWVGQLRKRSLAQSHLHLRESQDGNPGKPVINLIKKCGAVLGDAGELAGMRSGTGGD